MKKGFPESRIIITYTAVCQVIITSRFSSWIKVTYDDAKTTALKIEEVIAKVGHDTGHVQADKKTYNALPGCCKYDRPEFK